MKNYFYLIPLISAVFFSCSSKQVWLNSNTKIFDDLHDIEIIDNNTAISYSYGTGNIYKTFDKGKNWELISKIDSLYFEQIQFIDNQKGWISGSPNKILTTNDGGKNWINKSIEQEHNNVMIYAMYFKNSKVGYVGAITRDEKGIKTKIYKTENGAENWELVNEVREMILNIEQVGEILYATGKNVIIENIDKQSKWKYSYKDSTNIVGMIRDLDINGKKIIAISDNGYVINLDKGIWKSTKITNNRLRSILFVKNSEWITVGDLNKEDGNLFVTYDNGNNWKTEREITSDIHRIGKSKKLIWLVGKNGQMMMKKI